MVLQPPRGMRDFYPIEANLRKHVVQTIEKIYSSYGFDPIDTPALEYLDVLNKKSGDEIKKQIYQIEDMGLRFDFTVGLARFISNTSLPKPIKVYRSGPVWRRDEPQKGRYREFWQSDIDIIGSSSLKCEAELISCAYDALSALGLKNISFRLNSRVCLFDMMEKADVEKSKIQTAIRILDKLDKKGEGGVKQEMCEAGIGEESIDFIFKAISSRKQEFVDSDKLKIIIDLVKEYGINTVKIDYSLARGLDYYTGPIFEIQSSPFPFSIGGGGRYDELLSLYGSPSPAVGISIGVERVMDILKQEKKIDERSPFTQADVFIANAKESSYDYAVKIAKIMREKGIKVSLNITERDLRKQLEYANSLKFKYIIIVGEKEKQTEKVTLRNMETGEEKSLPIKDALSLIL
jgi:histidyl-tRNA synthetase